MKSTECVDCRAKIIEGYRCRSCAKKHSNQSKIDWPSYNDLLLLIKQFGYAGVGRKLGISGNGVKRHIKLQLHSHDYRLGISTS